MGTHRSGTTWLGEAFSKANDVAYWSEPRPVWVYGNWFREDDVLGAADARPAVSRHIRRRFGHFLGSAGRSIFCEKTPSNCLRIPFIQAVFPAAKFILILRDGRSVLSSVQEIQRKGAGWSRMWDRVRELRLREVPAHIEKLPLLLAKLSGNPRRAVWGTRPPGWREWRQRDTNSVFLAKQWAGTILRAVSDLQEVTEQQKMCCRFEQLAKGDAQLIEQIVDFSGIRDRDAMTGFIKSTCNPRTTEKWKSELRHDTLDEVRPVLQPALEQLGYSW